MSFPQIIDEKLTLTLNSEIVTQLIKMICSEDDFFTSCNTDYAIFAKNKE